MADKSEPRRCDLCGGPVGPDGQSLTPVPPRAAPPPKARAAPKAARQAEDAKDDITPVQRFERALKRRDAAISKIPKGNSRKDDKAR
jgi:hypothetical protein